MKPNVGLVVLGQRVNKVELSNNQIERYARHLVLDQIDEEGQEKILSAKILVIGAGGIGSPALLYLASAGVGEIQIIDDDMVDLSNLQRQILFQTNDVGRSKAETAALKLKALNSDPVFIAQTKRIVEENASDLIHGMSLVVDGSDSYETRSLVARTCAKLKVPLVSSSVTQFDGQLAVFRPWLEERPCYACLFPNAPRSRMSCSEVGVFGPVVGIMGTLAANQALKLILDLPINDQQLLLVDGLNLEFTPIRSKKSSNCAVCGKKSG